MNAGRWAVRDVCVSAIAGVLASAGTGLTLGRAHHLSSSVVALAALLGVVPSAIAATMILRRRPRRTTPADRVTLLRVTGCCCLASGAILAAVGDIPPRTWWFAAVAGATLALDAVDGQVARRTGTATEDGASLDMECDAVVLVALSVAAAPTVGWWVLVIGAMRYLLLAVAALRPELRTTLPRSTFRVAVAALQGVALLVVLIPAVPVPAARAVAGAAAALLAASFASEVYLKERGGSPRS